MKSLIKKIIKKIPIFRSIYKFSPNLPDKFNSSSQYWIDRYSMGGNSGKGSYGKLAKFKADILNRFVTENNVLSVIEYGFGDGNQLQLAKYATYIGFDVSPDAVIKCRKLFQQDGSKSFFLVSEYQNQQAELTLSLDVLYHLVEDAVFDEYMKKLFDSSKRFVIIYSTDTENNFPGQAPHVRHHKFMSWVDANAPCWRLSKRIESPFLKESNLKSGDFRPDFFIFEKVC